jgi:hypothetical protein
MTTITITNWGNAIESRECVLKYVTSEVTEADDIVATLPWSTRVMAPAEAEAFAECVRRAGCTVIVIHVP